jgi:hypothetical protein
LADTAVVSHDKIFSLRHCPGPADAAVLNSQIWFFQLMAVDVYGTVRFHLYGLSR